MEPVTKRSFSAVDTQCTKAFLNWGDHGQVCKAWQANTQAFFKKAYCAHWNHSIVRSSVGPKRFAPDLQGYSHDIFCQIYPNLSVLQHHFQIPCLHFCFLISMVRIYMNEGTGNLTVILFVALLFGGTERWSMNTRWGMLPRKNLKFMSIKTAGNSPKTRILLIFSLSVGMHPFSGTTNCISCG